MVHLQETPQRHRPPHNKLLHHIHVHRLLLAEIHNKQWDRILVIQIVMDLVHHLLMAEIETGLPLPIHVIVSGHEWEEDPDLHLPTYRERDRIHQ